MTLLPMQNLPLVYSQIDKIRLGRAYVTRLAMDFGGTPGRFTTQKAEPLDEWPFRLRLTYDALLAVNEAFKLHKARNSNQYPRHTSKCPSTDDTNIEISTLVEDLRRVRTKLKN